ncbi:MAG: acyl--CoA ligase, partial [bacterium]|nr:acyl--CoA ligase [bacterium]
METVLHYLKEKSVTQAERPIVSSKENKLSFSQLADLSGRFARGLYSLDLRKGDRIVIVLPNIAEYFVVYYGCLKSGCIAVTIHPDIRDDVLAHIIKSTGAGAIIYHSDFENKIGPIINKPELSIKQIRVDDSPETAANSYSKI